jgi:organic radical activating enzyme
MSDRYGVKDVFDTLQGEGARAGQRSVFVRFSGCNLWDGHPLHRDRGAGPCARWCDTDFFKGRVLSLEALLEEMDAAWPANPVGRWCVLTGGEPGLQVDEVLVDALHDLDWLIAIETNGTIDSVAIRKCDHVCLSPKRGTDWRTLGAAHELKVILPGAALGETGWTNEELAEAEAVVDTWDSGARVGLFVQPQDPILSQDVVELTLLKGAGSKEMTPEAEALLRASFEANVERAIQWVKDNPSWRLSLQVHKMVGLP